MSFSVIVCAYNEEQFLSECLQSLLRQTRPPDEIIVVNNASTDRTREIAAQTAGVRVIDEDRRGLVWARDAGYQAARGEILVYLDADCRAPSRWLEHVAQEFAGPRRPVAVTGPYRFYDWDLMGRALIRTYDVTIAPATHYLAQSVLRVGAVLYGGNFAVARHALEDIGGFDTSIEFHGEDTNLARRLVKVGRVRLCQACYLYTSARRYKAQGRSKVFRVYIRNFCSEIFRHRPSDTTHEDIRA